VAIFHGELSCGDFFFVELPQHFILAVNCSAMNCSCDELSFGEFLSGELTMQ
jgi:hypothetical protein